MFFGVMNGVPCFQRKMDEFINRLHNCFSYLENITIFGNIIEEHNKNLIFLKSDKAHKDKCFFFSFINRHVELSYFTWFAKARS